MLDGVSFSYKFWPHHGAAPDISHLSLNALSLSAGQGAVQSSADLGPDSDGTKSHIIASQMSHGGGG